MQISAKTLSPKATQELQQHLAVAICELNNVDQSSQFLAGFFTSTEQIVLAKRLAIGLLLRKKVPYEEIKQSLNVSSATISGVAVMMKTPGFKLALEKVAGEEWAEKQLQRITHLFR